MGKRQRLSEENSEDGVVIQTDAQDPPPKKLRKETNASAQRTLFVRSLPAVATTTALTELFSQNYPLKHATVVLDPETKQSKGYGFVTFADAEDAQRAAEEFNGKIFLGRKIKLEIAQPRSREITKGEGVDGRKKSKISAEAAAIKKARTEKMAEDKKPPKLIIRNLPWSIDTEEKLAELFRKFGKIKYSTLPKVKDKNTQRGFGFVVMRGRKNAEKALAAINGMEIDGRPVAVDWAVEKDVWETQNQAADVEEKKSAEEDGTAKGPEQEKVEPDEDDDVANFMRNFGDQLESEDDDDDAENHEDHDDSEGEDENEDDFEDIADDSENEVEEKPRPPKVLITDNSTTLFVRNLPFTTLDPDLKNHFEQFGPVRYARVVMDRATGRPKGTGFVCFYNVEDSDACFRGAPRGQPTGANAIKKGDAAAPKVGRSLLQNEGADTTGRYTVEGRVLQIAKAVEKETAVKLTEDGTAFRTDRDKDKRKLYLLSEGTVASGTPLYDLLAPSEVKMREDSAMQRKKLIQGNPTLHLSLTRLSIRNLPRNITSKDLKSLAREAVVGFAKDVRTGLRAQLSKEEEARGGPEMRGAEKQRKLKGKGIVRQAKIVFESRDGNKVDEDSGGRSRGYGFVEYSSHRWALMGLRWLNGHALESSTGKKQRLIVEFAIENAQVVSRRKEREEKARVRSKEVFEARERGEMPEKEKSVTKGQLMKKTRVGMKGKKGRVGEKPQKSFERVGPKPEKLSAKRKFEESHGRVKRVKGMKEGEEWKSHGRGSKVAKEKAAADAAAGGKDDKQVKRAQIIQKKRMAKRNSRGKA